MSTTMSMPTREQLAKAVIAMADRYAFARATMVASVIVGNGLAVSRPHHSSVTRRRRALARLVAALAGAA